MPELPEPYKGFRAGHRYIYSTEEGDSCSCGWQAEGFRMKDQAEWDTHVDPPHSDERGDTER